jgi:plasmid stability protein
MQKTTITIKNIPGELYVRLKQRAARNRRSINGEAISIIETALRSEPVNPEDFLISVRSLREKTGQVKLNDEFIRDAKSEGRP